jgi:hypothetical protein
MPSVKSSVSCTLPLFFAGSTLCARTRVACPVDGAVSPVLARMRNRRECNPKYTPFESRITETTTCEKKFMVGAFLLLLALVIDTNALLSYI